MSLGLHYKDERHIFDEAGEKTPFLEYPLFRDTGSYGTDSPPVSAE